MKVAQWPEFQTPFLTPREKDQGAPLIASMESYFPSKAIFVETSTNILLHPSTSHWVTSLSMLQSVSSNKNPQLA